MGCIDSSVSSASIDTLKSTVIRLKYVCEIEKQRCDEQLKKLQKLLCLQFTKPLKHRNKQIQHSMIENNLVYFGKIIIFLMLQSSSKVLQQHSTYFDDQNKLQLFKPSLDFILYCSTFLEKEDLIKFSSCFQSLFPHYLFPSDNDIKDEFVKQYKLQRKVSFQKQKEYIFQFSTSYQIPTQIINQIGHNYKYQATKYQ